MSLQSHIKPAVDSFFMKKILYKFKKIYEHLYSGKPGEMLNCTAEDPEPKQEWKQLSLQLLVNFFSFRLPEKWYYFIYNHQKTLANLP